jgi:thioredoxin 1
MKIRRAILLISLSMCLILSIMLHSNLGAVDFRTVPVKGMVTMVDLGAKSCIPCKMMDPILQKMEKLYAKKAAIVFIDIRYYPQEATRFSIRAIPTQIFFDKEGNEVYRHEGFMSERMIIAVLQDMGVK